MGKTDMQALGEAIAVLDAQEDGNATLLTDDARTEARKRLGLGEEVQSGPD